MLKEVIGKIVEAENMAESIENDAISQAESIRNNAALEANHLRTQPSQNIADEAKHILSHALTTAQSLVNEKLESAGDFCIDSKLIVCAADTIVDLFLKREN